MGEDTRHAIENEVWRRVTRIGYHRWQAQSSNLWIPRIQRIL